MVVAGSPRRPCSVSLGAVRATKSIPQGSLSEGRAGGYRLMEEAVGLQGDLGRQGRGLAWRRWSHTEQ